MSNIESVTWLRDEYKGREDELINFAGGAALVGVSRSTVSNWAKRHSDFPKIALLTGIGERRAKYVPLAEFLDFARAQLSKEPGSKTPGPHRPAALIRAEKVDHAQRQIARLEALERRQAVTLANTRRALAKHRAQLVIAQRQLEAEVGAVRQLQEEPEESVPPDSVPR
ncbi:hypothetical protein [Streptomyces sp. NPDC059452]|uniref:hypothetical protein n=1 Tax=Streptomyces sp. NPDC059452 TaxID=3346835 RepID=UPI0036B53FA0